LPILEFAAMDIFWRKPKRRGSVRPGDTPVSAVQITAARPSSAFVSVGTVCKLPVFWERCVGFSMVEDFTDSERGTTLEEARQMDQE
jgi:hypothetical protein